MRCSPKINKPTSQNVRISTGQTFNKVAVVFSRIFRQKRSGKAFQVEKIV